MGMILSCNSLSYLIRKNKKSKKNECKRILVKKKEDFASISSPKSLFISINLTFVMDKNRVIFHPHLL